MLLKHLARLIARVSFVLIRSTPVLVVIDLSASERRGLVLGEEQAGVHTNRRDRAFSGKSNRIPEAIESKEDGVGSPPAAFASTWSCPLKWKLPDLGWHTFRHMYRTWLETGAPTEDQQELLRHASIQTMMNVYGQAMPSRKEQLREGGHDGARALAGERLKWSFSRWE